MITTVTGKANVLSKVGLRAVLAICLFAAPTSVSVQAQSVPVTQNVTGWTGHLRVLPNVNLQQVTVAFDSDIPLNDTSSQIVFVIRGDFQQTSLPKPWSGNGRVLTGNGLVVVSPEDNESTSPVLAFLFNPAAVPDSLKQWKMDVFQVF